MARANKADTIQYNNDYNRRTYDSIKIMPSRADGQRIRSAAAEAGQSVNAFVLGCVWDRIGRGAGGADDPAL